LEQFREDTYAKLSENDKEHIKLTINENINKLKEKLKPFDTQLDKFTNKTYQTLNFKLGSLNTVLRIFNQGILQIGVVNELKELIQTEGYNLYGQMSVIKKKLDDIDLKSQ